jgi:O-antigen/teichoic acid export membrane protein
MTTTATPDPELIADQGEPRAQKESGMLRRILSGTFHYGLGQSLPQVVRFLLIPVYAPFLTADDYGILELTGALGAFLVLLMRFGVPGAISRFYFDHPEGAMLRNYVTTIACFLLASSAIVALGTFLIGPWLLGRLLPDLPFYPYAVLAIFSSLIGCNQNLQDRLVQAREQAPYAAKLTVGRATVSILLTLIFVVIFQWGALGMILAELIAAGLFFIQAIRYLKPDLTGSFQLPLLKPTLAYSMGILPSHFIGSVAPLITRSFLANADSLAAVGLLGLASRFTQPLTILGFAFQNAFIPVYFSVRNEKTEKSLSALANTAQNVWLGAIGCALVVSLCAPPVIELMMPARFHSAGRLIPVLSLGFLGQVLHSLFAVEVYYSKKTYIVPAVSAIAAAVTIAVTVLTVREYGELGMAWAMSLGTLTSALVGGVVANRLVAIPHPWWEFTQIAVVGSIIYLVSRLYVPHHAIAEILWAALACLCFPIALWLLGNQTVINLSRSLRRSSLS